MLTPAQYKALKAWPDNKAAHSPSSQAHLGDVPETNFEDIPGHKEALK